MSYSQNGSNGYMNGSYGREASNGYDGVFQDTGPRDSGRARRAGGYGGFMGDDLPLPADNDEPAPLRQRGFEEVSNGAYGRGSPDRVGSGHHGRRASRERDGSSASNARAYGSGPGGRQIEGQFFLMLTATWKTLLRRRSLAKLLAIASINEWKETDAD